MNIVYYLHQEKSVEVFEKKLLWLKNRYKIISMQELREYIYCGLTLHNSCVITVDDGWLSTYEVIYPVMKKYNLPFAIFVSPKVCESGMNFWYYTYEFMNQEVIKDVIIKRGLFSEGARKYDADLILKELPVDTIYDILEEVKSKYQDISVPRGFMNTKEVVELYKSGLVEIGAHSVMHPVLSNESPDRSAKEINDSVDGLSAILGLQVKTFAYPNGLEGLDFGDREMFFLKNKGVDMAFSVNPGIITTSTNPMSIPRWGSINRLMFGRLGEYLPSRSNQANIRKAIKKYKLL